MEHQNLAIYPIVKTIIASMAAILAICAGICCVCYLARLTDLAGFEFSRKWYLGETICVFQYIASLILLIMAPWCATVLLSGRGSPLLRFCLYAGILLIPIGAIMTGLDNPLPSLFGYYAHLLSGHGATRSGFHIIWVFRAVGNVQITFICIAALFAWIYTKGYPNKDRRLFLAWAIMWFLNAIIFPALTMATTPPIPYVSYGWVLVVSLIAFWSLTAFLAFKLAGNARRIAGLPEKADVHISEPNDDKN